jgi:hypothetical protein
LFNATFRVLAPTIYLVITAALLYAIGADNLVRDYWRVTVIYFAMRTVYQLAAGRRRIVRWGYQAVVAAIATSLSVLVYRELLPQIACQFQRTFGCRRARPQLRVFVSAETYAAQERLGILDEAECRAPAKQERRST